MTFKNIRNLSFEEYKIKEDVGIMKPIEYELYSKWFIENKENIKLKKSSTNFKLAREGLTCPGVPDYFYKNNEIGKGKKRRIFIEFKKDDDGLRSTQIKWIFNHPGIKVRVIWFKFC